MPQEGEFGPLERELTVVHCQKMVEYLEYLQEWSVEVQKKRGAAVDPAECGR